MVGMSTKKGVTKRFYIDVEVPPFNGKLSIDIDAGSEKQAWENYTGCSNAGCIS